MDQKAPRARQLRSAQTKSEALLWSLLRAKQVCGLKFRRQHPIGPYFVDFACVSKKLVIEIDGGYHDFAGEKDLKRQSFIKRQGWDVLRFNNEEVEEDVEVVIRGIAKHLELEYEFVKRRKTGSGMLTKRSPD